jgi:hypothetical protein
VQTVGHLNGPQIVDPVVGAKGALLKRMPDAEQLFGVVAQLLGNEGAEVNMRIVGNRSGRHPDDGKAKNENTRANQVTGHGTLLLIVAADRAARRHRRRWTSLWCDANVKSISTRRP